MAFCIFIHSTKTKVTLWVHFQKEQQPQVQLSLTLHYEVNPGGFGVIVCLHRAGVWTFIIYIHILDHDAVLGRRVDQDDHSRVYGPLVIPSIEDCAAV